MKIGFIGTGNMGSAIIRAYSPAAAGCGIRILAYNRTRSRAEELAKICPITVVDSIGAVTRSSDIVFVCVEPKNFSEVMPEVAKYFNNKKILVSIAAGITIETLESYLGQDAKIIRTMPNTPIMYGLGATAMVRNRNVSDADFEAVRAIFESGGITGEVSEDLISAVIGVSGSSPAYTYMYIDALTQAGVESGMDPEMSRRFAAQAVLGAARMVLASGESPSVLCDRVCTPGGTTIEAVGSLKEAGFEETVKNGALAAVNRSIEMSK